MYMPGRSRTGSSPSRTVMSLAVYVASLIEKALETGRFRAPRILPEHAVGICLCEAQSGGFCDDFAKVLVGDLGGQFVRLKTVLGRGLDRRSCGLLEGRGGRFRERSDREPKALRRKLSERRFDARLELSELARPCRGARVDMARPVTCNSRRPCVSRDLRTDSRRPSLDHRPEPARGTETSQLACDIVPDAFHRTGCTSPGETSSSCAGSAGSAAAGVDVIRVWPFVATRRASARRRSGPTSEKTS